MQFGDKQDWDGFATEAIKNSLYGRPFNRNPERVKSFLSPYIELKGKTILDCGCSIGHWCNDFANMGMHHFGIDQSLIAINQARKIYPQFSFANDFLWNLNYSIEFDLLSTITVLQHNTLIEKKS